MELASRVKSAVLGNHELTYGSRPPRIGMVVDMSDGAVMAGLIPSFIEKQHYPYSRPEFLFYSDEEIKLSGDQSIRPVVCPKYPYRMPLSVGYAEVINGGKTALNEDQATARLISLAQTGYDAEEAKVLESQRQSISRSVSSEVDEAPLLSSNGGDRSNLKSVGPRAEAGFFAIFDGHAGPGAAIAASKCLHEHIKLRLSEVLEVALQMDRQENLLFSRRLSTSSYNSSREDTSEITCNQLVIGAMEAAFVDMDEQIAQDKLVWRMPGGCAAIAALAFLGKVYIANAGDCRAILVTGSDVKAISNDFTPATERKRLQSLAYQNPELIGNSFSRLEYSRRLSKKDLKSKVLYRDWFMNGWASKTVKDSDLKPPLISDCFKKKRLLNTIGVSRGFGDQHLLTVDERLHIKPFLTPVPEVQVVDVRVLDSVGDRDVIVMASDGLWDVLSNEDAALIVRSALSSTEPDDTSRYCMAAQELVVAARGSLSDDRRWQMHTGAHASTDDITVFVIPLKHCIAPPAVDDDDDDEMLNLNVI